MPGHWRRLGLIGSASGAAPWAVSHSALPALDQHSGRGGVHLYVSTRDSEGRARIARGRFALEPTPALTTIESEPVLDIGPLGAFDDRGVTMSSIVSVDGRTYLYYTGWMLGVTVPFYLAAGLAISDDGRTFRRASRAPLLERSDDDPFLTASPFVMVDNGLWRMWYVSGSQWQMVDGTPRHRYHIKYAESRDGLHWTRDGRVCLDYASSGEYAFARPCVRYDGGVYRMWYAYRGAHYRIGYAESSDGLSWTRKDREGGLDASGRGWDSEMVEYPWVFESDGRRYMLYNGDDYGRTGVGLAVWETGQDTDR